MLQCLALGPSENIFVCLKKIFRSGSMVETRFFLGSLALKALVSSV